MSRSYSKGRGRYKGTKKKGKDKEVRQSERNSIVSKREAYKAPKIVFGAVSTRYPGARWCVGCAGAQALARQKSTRHL